MLLKPLISAIPGEVPPIAGTGSSGYNNGPGSQATFTAPNGTCHSPSGDTLLVSDHNTIRIITNSAPAVSAVNNELEVRHFSLTPNLASDFIKLSVTPVHNRRTFVSYH